MPIQSAADGKTQTQTLPSPAPPAGTASVADPFESRLEALMAADMAQVGLTNTILMEGALGDPSKPTELELQPVVSPYNMFCPDDPYQTHREVTPAACRGAPNPQADLMDGEQGGLFLPPGQIRAQLECAHVGTSDSASAKTFPSKFPNIPPGRNFPIDESAEMELSLIHI